MTSVPLTLLNYSKPVVYPTSTSPAWQLTPSGYISADPLSNGVGYWIKFGAAQDITYNHLGIFSIDMPVHTGWNIIGSITQQVDITQVEPINTSITSSYFEYDNGYVISNNIRPGKGYWVKVSQPGILRITMPTDPPTPNLISPANGSIAKSRVTLKWSSSPGATSYDLIVQRLESGDPLFNYGLTTTSKGFILTDGTYQWRVRAVNFYGASLWSQPWTFTIGNTPDDYVESFESLDQITIVDASGSQQSLFLTNEGRILGSELLMSVEMPPAPPDGIFNVRFESGKYIESIPTTLKSKKIPIKIKNAVFPITVNWKLKPENAASYTFTRPDKGIKINMSGSGSMVLNNLRDGTINLEGIAYQPVSPVGKNNWENSLLESIPTTYELSQNYPNPFNPVTQINYALPDAGYVTLKIYDVLGREVATVVNEFKEAGYYSATWGATNVPSGVYFYKLTASLYTSVKKMLLVR